LVGDEPGTTDPEWMRQRHLLRQRVSLMAEMRARHHSLSRGVYREAAPSDTYDRLPDDVREAVDRIDAYAGQHCEDDVPDFS
jgi:hypothetical protein